MLRRYKDSELGVVSSLFALPVGRLLPLLYSSTFRLRTNSGQTNFRICLLVVRGVRRTTVIGGTSWWDQPPHSPPERALIEAKLFMNISAC